MTVRVRTYSGLEDFVRIGEFLVETYREANTPNWLQARWEYMHFHPNLDLLSLGKIGIWEEDQQHLRVAIVGVVHYEDSLGDAYFQLRSGYEHLKPAMLAHAEEHLAKRDDRGLRHLRLFINQFDVDLMALAETEGYRQIMNKPQYVSLFPIRGPIQVPTLPAGFHLRSLTDDNDLSKLNRCLWRGFDHAGEPTGDLSGRRLMQSAPGFRPELNMVVTSPGGDFVSYSGSWYDSINRVAYIEPVATDPEFRRLGLGKAAVLECVRRCAELGATVVHVGSGQPFYEAIGFKKSWADYIWEKSL